MIAYADSCKDKPVCSGSSLSGFELDDTQTAMLLSIARQHCKLALEHGRTGTTQERRLEIMKEIQSLRSTRDEIILGWGRSTNK